MDLENSDLLEKAIIDAAALKEAAMKSAKNEILEKNVKELHESFDRFLSEQDEENPLDALGGLGGEMDGPQPNDPIIDQIPLGATEGTNNCSCPEENDEIEIDFNALTSQPNVSGQQDLSASMTESGENIMFESDVAPAGADLMKYYLEEGDAVSQVANAMTSSASINKDVVKDAINELTFFKSKVNDESVQQDIAEKINALASLIGAQEPQATGAENSMATSLEEEDYQMPDLSGLFDDEDDNMEKAFTDFLNQPSSENEFGADNEFYQVRNEEPEVRIDMMTTPTGDSAGPTAGEEKFGRGAEMAKLTNDTVASKEFERYKRIIKSLREEKQALLKQNVSLAKKVEAATKVGKLMREAQSQFEEVSEMNANLLLENLKLVYKNQALSSPSLNERQKALIIERVSHASSIDEAKTVFGVLNESLTNGSSRNAKAETLNESIKNRSTLVLKASSSKEENQKLFTDQMLRIAGIKK